MLLRWIHPLLSVYALWFVCGFLFAALIALPVQLNWLANLYLMLCGITALIWYARRYGTRQALILFVVCGSLSYAAEWIGVHTGFGFGQHRYGSQFAPAVYGVPLSIPLAWCLLLVIAKALAPVRRQEQLWSGLSLKQALAEDKRKLQRMRRRGRIRQYALPALWGASMSVAIHLLLDPAAAQKRYWFWSHQKGTAEPFSWNALYYSVPVSNFICWWITALIILNIVNYLHDEYFESRQAAGGIAIPLLLLLAVESMFLTLALSSGLWWAALLNIVLLAGLFVWRKVAVK